MATAPGPGSSSALLTDRYELTMLQAGLADGTAHRRCVFEVFARRLPPGRRYGVVAGTGRLLDLIADFRFGEAELAELRDKAVVDEHTLGWLTSYAFRGDIDGYGEGECYLPGSPVLVVEGTFAEAVVLETLVLSVLNHDSAIAAAASRMVVAAGDRPCIEMGGRRTHERSAVAAARAAYIAGFASTSNLEAGRSHGLPTAGTAAHAFTLLHESERAAFAAQVASLGRGTTLLVDTYDVTEGVQTAVEVAGPGLGAVRIDSGDLLAQATAVRRQLDGLGAVTTRIVVTGDLDEHAIAALASAPVDAYGVGTSLVTGSGAPTAGLVYKMVARAADPSPESPLLAVAKRSAAKVGRGGRKVARRRLDSHGFADAELIGLIDPVSDRSANPFLSDASAPPEAGPTQTVPRDPAPKSPSRRTDPAGWGADGRDLLRPLVRAGRVVGGEPMYDARRRHRRSLAELPPAATRLSPGEPAIPTLFGAG